MHVSTHVTNTHIAEAIHSYVERRLHFALARFGHHVGQVTVRLSTDGPSDNHCRISAEVLPFGQVTLDEADPDLFAAIDRATGRIGRLFGRELDRCRDARLGRESVRTAA